MRDIIRYQDIMGKTKIFKPGVTPLCEICCNLMHRRMEQTGKKQKLLYYCEKQLIPTQVKYKCENFGRSLSDFF